MLYVRGGSAAAMAAQRQMLEQRVKMNSGMISCNGSPAREDKEEDMSRSALALFRAKEEEIERKKTEVMDKVHAQLGRAEQETKRLAEIREVCLFNNNIIVSLLHICLH